MDNFFQDAVVQEVESTMSGTVDASNTTLLLVAATIFVHEGKHLNWLEFSLKLLMVVSNLLLILYLLNNQQYFSRKLRERSANIACRSLRSYRMHCIKTSNSLKDGQTRFGQKRVKKHAGKR